MSGQTCKDCGSSTRKLSPPGPRCATCHRAVKKTRSARSHASSTLPKYNLTPEDYEALRRAQNGVCYICQRATGASRRLSVDHDHSCCPTTPTCGKCTRALLCRPCNDLLGHVRDDVDTLRRAALVIRDRPAQKVLRQG